MARTPLLRVIERLVREHDVAERLGVSPGELRERRAEAGYSRGEFLKRSGAVGAALVVVGPAAFARSARAAGGSSARIAIVGGGIAGLNAALTLQDKGLASTVYEASDRVGGRMHSDRSGYWANGQVSEFCGELIDSNHTTILGLAKRFGLPVAICSPPSPPARPRRTGSSAGATAPSRPTSDFGPVRDAAKKRPHRGGVPDALGQLQARRVRARPDERL